MFTVQAVPVVNTLTRLHQLFRASTTCQPGLLFAMQDERSQQQNRAKAMRILKSRVYDYYQQQEQSAYDQKRKDAIGTGDRSERIRTYNYPQNRVTDHRIGLTLNKLDKIMAGDLDEIIEALIVCRPNAKLEQLRNE